MNAEQPSRSSAELAARQDRLEQQLAELSRKLSALEHQLSSGSSSDLTSAATVPLPPPPQGDPLPPMSNPPDSRAAIKSLPKEPALPGASTPSVLTPPPPAKISLENRLGSQVFNRVGIIALLIGATWFLKLAVDNQWIGATGRVLIGLLSGAALVLWSERFRRKGFPAFSYSLKALGSGVLYLALWAAFQLYHLLPASVALAAMLLVTAWNAWMAWAQDAELLAAYALAGGLSTPLLLSTGGNHEIFLFTYLLALDIACVVLVRLKLWPRLLAVTAPATIAYFIGWYEKFFTPATLGTTIFFILAIAATFLLPAFTLRTPDNDTAPKPSRPPTRLHLLTEILLPLLNAAFLSLALYSALQDSGYHNLLPWLMVALAALYLALIRLPQPQLTAALHLSLAVVFLTIAIPLKASGSWTTVGWLVEGVALLWTSTRIQPAASAAAPPSTKDPLIPPTPLNPTQPTLTPDRALRLLASAALLLGFGGILVDLFLLDSPSLTPFANQPFATALTGLAAFALTLWIAHRFTPSTQASPNLTRIAAASLIAFNLTALLSIVDQINLLFVSGPQNADAALQRALAVSAFLMLYGAVLLAAGFWKRSSFVRWQALILLVFTIAKTFLYDMRNLSQGYRVLSFVGLGALLMAVSFVYQKDWLALRDPLPTPQPHQDPSA